MNTANLQMEGVLLALAALCRALREKDVLNEEEFARILTEAENGTSGRSSRLSEANLEAIRFPIRFLRRALAQDASGGIDYDLIAAGVGKERDAAAAPPT